MAAKRSVKKRRGWHPEKIKAEIRMRGTTLSRLATDNDMHDSAVRAALIRPVPKAERVISEFLGVSLHALWPDRYSSDGQSISHVRDENSAEHNDAHGLSAGAV